MIALLDAKALVEIEAACRDCDVVRILYITYIHTYLLTYLQCHTYIHTVIFSYFLPFAITIYCTFNAVMNA